jgi:hypothetical protein
MKTKQSDYYVYMLKNGVVKCGNPFDDLNNIDCRYSIYQCEAESAAAAVNEFLTYNQIPQFMRDKIMVV